MPYKDKAIQRASQLKYRQKRLDAIDKYKMEKGCCVCGYKSHPRALQFHHREPDKKDFEICSMMRRNRTVEFILKEIEKCDVICANCHLILHYGPQTDALLVVKSTLDGQGNTGGAEPPAVHQM